MNFGICFVPAAPLRKSPAHESEMVNQLLFGETMQIIENGAGNWSFIKTIPGNYEGWINKLQISLIDESIALADYNVINNELPFNEILLDDSPMQIPMAASLPSLKNGKVTFGNSVIQYKSTDTVSRSSLKPTEKKLNSLITKWVNAPYMWGGRTILGVDCSGLTQVLFKMMGIDLLRDASQQAQQGDTIDFLQQARLGDLAFFDDAEGKIYHVGILLAPDRIVHASGKVRIDSIDTAGIMNLQTGQRTHQLRIIKRYF